MINIATKVQWALFSLLLSTEPITYLKQHFFQCIDNPDQDDQVDQHVQVIHPPQLSHLFLQVLHVQLNSIIY